MTEGMMYQGMSNESCIVDPTRTTLVQYDTLRSRFLGRLRRVRCGPYHRFLEYYRMFWQVLDPRSTETEVVDGEREDYKVGVTGEQKGT